MSNRAENVMDSDDKNIDATLADLESMENVHEASEEEFDADDIEEIVGDEAIEAADDNDAVEEDAEPVEAADAEVSEEELTDLELQIDKSEVYSKQQSAAVNTVEAGEVKSGKKGAKKASTPRQARDLNAVPASLFVLSGDVNAMDQAAIDQAKADTIAKQPTQKKPAEKFDNVFLSMAAGRAPSKYVVQAMQMLDKNGSATSADLIAGFRASGLGDGTARSQTGQIMTLFPVLGIADRSGKQLTLRTDSNVAAYIRSHIA